MNKLNDPKEIARSAVLYVTMLATYFGIGALICIAIFGQYAVVKMRDERTRQIIREELAKEKP